MSPSFTKAEVIEVISKLVVPRHWGVKGSPRIPQVCSYFGAVLGDKPLHHCRAVRDRVYRQGFQFESTEENQDSRYSS